MFDAKTTAFDKIYDTDLVYIKDCWKLCGDAHCCGFFKYKDQFKLLAKVKFHELPLLPGEYEFLQERGWWAQFGDADHKVIEYQLDHRTIKLETMVSRKPMCACEHDTRLTVCRLYPLLPQFNIDGVMTGARTFGIFEEFEKIENLEPGCKVLSLPFDQIQGFLDITTEISNSPKLLFYFAAYVLALEHVQARIIAGKSAKPDTTAFSLFESMMLFGKLVDHDVLKPQLIALADQFEARYGPEFQL